MKIIGKGVLSVYFHLWTQQFVSEQGMSEKYKVLVCCTNKAKSPYKTRKKEWSNSSLLYEWLEHWKETIIATCLLKKQTNKENKNKRNEQEREGGRTKKTTEWERDSLQSSGGRTAPHSASVTKHKFKNIISSASQKETQSEKQEERGD